MSLYEQIMAYYPDLTPADFAPGIGTIVLWNDSNGSGDYIRSWAHPKHPHPPFGRDPHGEK